MINQTKSRTLHLQKITGIAPGLLPACAFALSPVTDREQVFTACAKYSPGIRAFMLMQSYYKPMIIL